MRQKFTSHRQTQYGTIRLDTKKCQACWKCLDVCKNNVIGRINMPWHKHAKIKNPDTCTACSKCVSVCESGALSLV